MLVGENVVNTAVRWPLDLKERTCDWNVGNLRTKLVRVNWWTREVEGRRIFVVKKKLA